MDLDNLRSRYRGSKTTTYEKERKKSEKWFREQEAVANYIGDINSGKSDLLVLDVPVGTGRFFDIYDKHSLDVIGVDVSRDMLDEAKESIPEHNTKISLQQGDVMCLSELEINADVVICMRFMNWLDMANFKQAFKNIAATNPGYIVVGVRVRNLIRHQIAGPVRMGYHYITSSNDSKTIIHNEDTVVDFFSNQGFNIVEKTLVDSWLFGDKYIYLLSTDSV